MKHLCSIESCNKPTSISTYDGKEEALCLNHYLDKAEQQKANKEGLYEEVAVVN